VDEMAKRAKDIAFKPEAVRADAEARFSLTRMVKEYQDLYEEMLSGEIKGADMDEAVA
jgi:hypothetical protein